MNIGIFTDAYYPQINGVVTSTIILKTELENLGHNVTIITVKDNKVKDELPNVLRLPSIPFWKLPNFRVGAVYSRKIMKKIKKLDLDIIHTQTEFTIGIFARIVARRLNIPIVHTYHTMYEDYTHYFSTKRVEKYAKELARKASKVICDTVDGVVVPTDKVKIKLQNYGLNKTIYIVPTGIDLRSYDNNKYTEDKINLLKGKLGLIKDNKVILFVGRIAKEKNINVIIKSMKDIIEHRKDVTLLIVGGGPELENLRKLTIKENIDEYVIFTGEIPWEEISSYYHLGDVFVSASTSETQGITFLEAMASKIPVVAKYDTNLDGVIENGKNGKTFEEDNELATILLELLSNEGLCNDLITNAYQMIEPLSSAHFGERIVNVYNKILSERYLSKRKRNRNRRRNYYSNYIRKRIRRINK